MTVTVIVTGVGAIIGQGVVKSLRACGRPVRIVGVDRNAGSMGSYLCDAFRAKPPCEESDPAYLDFWRDLVQREGAQLILPALEVDVSLMDRERAFFDSLGVVLGLNQAALVRLSADKWRCGQAIEALGLPSIPSRIDGSWEELVGALGPAPLLMKPRDGNGSRGIVRLHDEPDYDYWRRKQGDSAMVQRIVGTDDAEYTVGLFGFGDGGMVPPIVFRRRLSAAGSTGYVETVRDADIESATQVLTRHFRPLGPTNYQFRKEGSVPYLLEINPRFSSSTSLRTAFGYNEAGMALDFFLQGSRPSAPLLRHGRAWRYSEDFVAYDRDSL
ncbi:ATP-grasp domain-containing protein [Cupriavidus sp. 2TAF22]|uniref:ATP-grasp domain-containing protein n=1 Tax=unclassified Cupriavidus TaxID=2640874 RepID=UPI003F93C3ED